MRMITHILYCFPLISPFSHLRGGVVSLPGVADEAHDGRNVDDAALSLLEHELARRLRDVEYPAKV